MCLLEKGCLGGNGLDLDDRKLLAVTPLALVALALLLLEDDDLVTALVLEDLGRNLGALEDRSANLECGALTGGENVGDLDGATRFRVGVAVDDQNVALGDSELLALGFDGRFHK